jgi:isocitrate dehydrogenase kinase/phosphatase
MPQSKAPRRRHNDLDSASRTSTDRLSTQQAEKIARVILAGLDKHYALFRYHAQQAKTCFERGDFHGIRRLARERIDFYDQRVAEAIAVLETEPKPAPGVPDTDRFWQQVKRTYVGLLD